MGEEPIFAKALREASHHIARKIPSYAPFLAKKDEKNIYSGKSTIATGEDSSKPLSSDSGALSREPDGRPFSAWNVGVLAVATGIFAGTLLINRKQAV
jgi:hypothetical protein